MVVKGTEDGGRGIYMGYELSLLIESLICSRFQNFPLISTLSVNSRAAEEQNSSTRQHCKIHMITS